MRTSRRAVDFKDNTLRVLRGHRSEREREEVRDGATEFTLYHIDFLLAIADLWASKLFARVLWKASS